MIRLDLENTLQPDLNVGEVILLCSMDNLGKFMCKIKVSRMSGRGCEQWTQVPAVEQAEVREQLGTAWNNSGLHGIVSNSKLTDAIALVAPRGVKK